MITGSIPAIATPMFEDGRLDLPRLRAFIDWHISEGSHALVMVGTTGESPTVDVEEHCQIIQAAVEQAAGRVPVIAGTGANSTAASVGRAVLQQTDVGRLVSPFQGDSRGRRSAADSLQRAGSHRLRHEQ